VSSPAGKISKIAWKSFLSKFTLFLGLRYSLSGAVLVRLRLYFLYQISARVRSSSSAGITKLFAGDHVSRVFNPSGADGSPERTKRTKKTGEEESMASGEGSVRKRGLRQEAQRKPPADDGFRVIVRLVRLSGVWRRGKRRA
jgi:hypothetical protein